MSCQAERRVIGRRWLVALASGALAAGAAAPSAAVSATPDKVIDAGTNADEAAQALNEGCADMENCSWETDGGVTTGYGPARIVGDALYNCSEEEYAETAVGVSDERGESTSISESIALEISLGFLDLEKQSLEFELFSKQAQSFSTEVRVTNAVAVPPGWKGWTETKLLSANVNGSAYVTQGIHLIQVKNIDMQYPGYQGPDAAGNTPVVYIGYRTPMTADDLSSRCQAVGATASAARATQAARSRRAALVERFTLTLCRTKRAAAASARRRRHRCIKRRVSGPRPPRIDQATATLERRGLVYAAETDRRGGLRLTTRRKITPGSYRLVIREKPRKMVIRNERHRKLHDARQQMHTIVPITIR